MSLSLKVYQATYLPISEHFDGHSCEASVECTENLECRESICQCSESEYWDISKCYTSKQFVRILLDHCNQSASFSLLCTEAAYITYMQYTE